MPLKNLFKPTKTKLMFALTLFLILGFWKFFTLENFLTGETYKDSLFNQYKFYEKHLGDSWYKKEDKFFWPYVLFLHLFVSYATICISAFIVSRLRRKE